MTGPRNTTPESRSRAGRWLASGALATSVGAGLAMAVGAFVFAGSGEYFRGLLYYFAAPPGFMLGWAAVVVLAWRRERGEPSLPTLAPRYLLAFIGGALPLGLVGIAVAINENFGSGG